jgi:hypothetical protein
MVLSTASRGVLEAESTHPIFWGIPLSLGLAYFAPSPGEGRFPLFHPSNRRADHFGHPGPCRECL